jgi:hypothetical protein
VVYTSLCLPLRDPNLGEHKTDSNLNVSDPLLVELWLFSASGLIRIQYLF